MPKLIRRLPSYRLHKATGCAVVTLAGRDHYLGPHGTPESLDAYKRLISEWTAAGLAASSAIIAASPACNDLRICELIAAHFEYAKSYYVKDGKPSGTHRYQFQRRSTAARHLPCDHTSDAPRTTIGGLVMHARMRGRHVNVASAC
jgi:hypothetical protein